MDHEVVARLIYTIHHCDWLLNSSRNHFSLRQERNVGVTMEFEVPKRHILWPTLSTSMVQRVLWWERQNRSCDRKRQGPMAEKCCYDKFLITFFWEVKRSEDKRRQENHDQTWIFFGHIIKKSAHSFFLGAWSFLLVHIWFTPSEGPKAL